MPKTNVVAVLTPPIVILLAAMAVVPDQASAQDPSADEAEERFSLFNGCSPMNLSIEDVSDSAAEIGLTKERIQILAESRLRAARLFSGTLDPPNNGVLHISVLVTRGAFSFSLNYLKWVWDAWNSYGYAATWDDGMLGEHRGNAGTVLQDLSEYLDRFLLAYLRANEAVCQSY